MLHGFGAQPSANPCRGKDAPGQSLLAETGKTRDNEPLRGRFTDPGPWPRPGLKCTIMRIGTHPGEILREEFMRPNGLSSNALSIALRVPVTRVNDIVLERRSITADTALRLARYFGTAPQYWIYLQADYDLAKADSESGRDIERMIEPRRVETAGVASPAVPETVGQAPPAARPEAGPANSKVWARIVAKAWADEAYKKRLLADPGAVAAEEGLVVPAGVALRMVEAARKQAWLVLPPRPREGEAEELQARLAATAWPW
jgi:addiction module HigA family antidote